MAASRASIDPESRPKPLYLDSGNLVKMQGQDKEAWWGVRGSPSTTSDHRSRGRGTVAGRPKAIEYRIPIIYIEVISN